jgi:hypothetical protein
MGRWQKAGRQAVPGLSESGVRGKRLTTIDPRALEFPAIQENR